MTWSDDNFWSFGQPERWRWLRGAPSSASAVVSPRAKRRHNTSVGDPEAHRNPGEQGFALVRSDGQTMRRLCRELVAVLGEIPADAVKPIRDRPGRVGWARGGSGAAREPSREGIVLAGRVRRSGHGSGDVPDRQRQRRCELAEARLAILLCSVAVRRPPLDDARHWTRDAILGALRSPPPKRPTS